LRKQKKKKIIAKALARCESELREYLSSLKSRICPSSLCRKILFPLSPQLSDSNRPEGEGNPSHRSNSQNENSFQSTVSKLISKKFAAQHSAAPHPFPLHSIQKTMSTFRITYIGGPTMLLDFDGIRILTDPTFDPAPGDYPSGPVTLRKLGSPAIPLEELGSLDYVLLSHDHHSDNLDRAGRESLSRAKAVLTTSEGAQRLGGNSVGLIPWQAHDIETGTKRTLRVVATPGRHGPAGMDRGAVIGFVAFFTDSPEKSVYVSGDTVWYEGVAETARRFPVQTAILHIGAARVPEVGPFHLTLTSEEAVQAAMAFHDAVIVPTHFEGWAHFSEGKEDILSAFRSAGIEHRLFWPRAGHTVEVPTNLRAPADRLRHAS
jgi:L-ascorbate metabolism protein UlaG (beta-lactamase superfamily)